MGTKSRVESCVLTVESIPEEFHCKGNNEKREGANAMETVD